MKLYIDPKFSEWWLYLVMWYGKDESQFTAAAMQSSFRLFTVSTTRTSEDQV